MTIFTGWCLSRAPVHTGLTRDGRVHRRHGRQQGAGDRPALCFVHRHIPPRCQGDEPVRDPGQAGAETHAPRTGPGAAAGRANDRRLVADMLAKAGGSLRDLRNKALVAVAYTTLCRRSELVALRRDDLEIGKDGFGTLVIRRGKGDQEAKERSRQSHRMPCATSRPGSKLPGMLPDRCSAPC